MTVASSWPADMATPRLVRQFVRRALEGLVDEERCCAVMLVASELVTNAVAHAGTPVEVNLSVTLDGAVRVVVSDQEPTGIEAHPRAIDLLATTGRGLAIVEALSARWGAEQRPGGKCVWAEIAPNL